MQVEYHLWFPSMKNRIVDNIISFSIGNMKCISTAIVFYELHCYDLQGNEILIDSKPFHVGERWIVDEGYESYVDTFEMSENQQEQLHNINTIRIKLVMIGVNDNNPVKFNQVMLQNKEYDGTYHEPDEAIVEANIGFNKNRYVNLYSNKSENYVQIIRPTGEYITTKNLRKSEYTVIAPHLEHEADIDNSSNLLMEFYNQNEQLTTIFNSGFKM